jgi:hypothetical protein
MKIKMLFGLVCATISALPAQAANWQEVAHDSRIAGAAGSRTIEVDLDSIKRAADEISVIERETQSGITGGGYSCREGDIRHGLISKDVVDTFCRSDIPDRCPGPHEPTWVTYETHNLNGRLSYRQYDRAGLCIINRDFVRVPWRDLTIAIYPVSYDCRGYYRKSERWIWLDTTDKIGGVPRGYVSPERQIANWICAK